MKAGGKETVNEITVSENAEEVKAKDYASALEQMQNALKREKQIKMVKTMNEKNKTHVSFYLSFYTFQQTVLVEYTI